MQNRRHLLKMAAFLGGALSIGGTRRSARPVVHRRVVTGVDESGRSVILRDGEVPRNARFAENGAMSSDLWRTDRVPVDLSNQTDPMVDYELTPWPANGGAVARIATWAPGFEYPMHASDTIDVLFVLSGAIELIVEGGSTVLRAGDSVVQQGTKHSWRVVGNEPVTFAGVLISGRRATPPTGAAAP